MEGSPRRRVHRRPRSQPGQDVVAASMGLRVSNAISRAATPSVAHRLLAIISMVRYRFFLYAGLLPYGLGAAWAYTTTGTLDAPIFWSGLGGVVLAVIGVEAFNEYFD